MLDDDVHLVRTFVLAAEARSAGDHPFGALLVVENERVAEARNRVITDRDITAHAETVLVRDLERQRRSELLADGTVYASCEPCPMCVGAMFWAGVRRVVYGLSTARLTQLATAPGATPVGFTITAPEIGAAATPPMTFDGPHREDDAAAPHLGFWVR
ncbi:MAG: nucleoside deaminase [Acidimicrobiia bacterium]|nr:nucleoside deaminase [Acidimicrobiia bacterium]